MGHREPGPRDELPRTIAPRGKREPEPPTQSKEIVTSEVRNEGAASAFPQGWTCSTMVLPWGSPGQLRSVLPTRKRMRMLVRDHHKEAGPKQRGGQDKGRAHP